MQRGPAEGSTSALKNHHAAASSWIFNGQPPQTIRHADNPSSLATSASHNPSGNFFSHRNPTDLILAVEAAMPTPMRHDPTQPGARRPAPRRPSQTRPKPQDSSSTQTELLPNTTPRDNLGSSVPTACSITETYSHKEQDNQAGALRNRSEPTPNGDRAQPRSWKSDSLTTRNLLTSGHLPCSWHPPRQLPGSKREDPSRLLHPTVYIGCVNSRINLFSRSSRFPQIHTPHIPTIAVIRRSRKRSHPEDKQLPPRAQPRKRSKIPAKPDERHAAHVVSGFIATRLGFVRGAGRNAVGMLAPKRCKHGTAQRSIAP
jgi:hypothetical protein